MISTAKKYAIGSGPNSLILAPHPTQGRPTPSPCWSMTLQNYSVLSSPHRLSLFPRATVGLHIPIFWFYRTSYGKIYIWSVLHFNDSCVCRIDQEIGLENLEVLLVEGSTHLTISPVTGKEILTDLLSLLEGQLLRGFSSGLSHTYLLLLLRLVY